MIFDIYVVTLHVNQRDNEMKFFKDLRTINIRLLKKKKLCGFLFLFFFISQHFGSRPKCWLLNENTN